MGQGGCLRINNQTMFGLVKTHEHSYQMNNWCNSFPMKIQPHSNSGNMYLEFEEGIFKVLSDCAGEITYAIENTEDILNISVNAIHGERCLWASLGGLSADRFFLEPGHSKLGWAHDGVIELTLRMHGF